MTRTVPDQIRGGVMWFSILLVCFMALFTAVIAGGRIDSADEFLMSLRQDRFNGIPLAFAVFLLVLTLPRPTMWKRAALAVIAGFILWLLVWQYLVQSDYGQLRARGIDPDAIVHAAQTH